MKKRTKQSVRQNKNKGDSRSFKETTGFLDQLHPSTKRGLLAVLLVTFAFVSILSFLGVAGPLGRGLSGILRTVFGVLAFFTPIFLSACAYLILKGNSGKGATNTDDQNELSSSPNKILYGGIIVWVFLSGLLHACFWMVSGGDLSLSNPAGGFVGGILSVALINLLGFWATALILLSGIIAGIAICLDWRFLLFAKSSVQESTVSDASLADKKQLEFSQKNISLSDGKRNQEVASVPKSVPLPSTSLGKSEKKPMPLLDGAIAPRVSNEEWKLPPFDLLVSDTSKANSGNIEAGSAIIQQTLKNFGIEVEMGEASVGPTVTQYTLRPATGVKLAQIGALRSDLALALAAKSLRLELPIPGKALVGVEVPNLTIATVPLRSVLETPEFVSHKSSLAIALGTDVAGKPQVVDLTKLPHLLIAGATGSGKSVAINTLLMSLIYRNSPRTAKFILVDPKRVELTLYQGLPHLLTPPITSPEKAVNALRWAVSEMERRYEELASYGKRNIGEYNPTAQNPLPYIVIVVDELADIMAVAGNDMEAVVVRLAQMARAVGIHLVLATQRPSVDVLTGLIKANITARMAFAVASQVDSRTILDSSGAEQLLGNGDMLFVSADQAKPRRVQGALVTDSEVKKVVEFCKRQVGAVVYDEKVTEKSASAAFVSGSGESSSEDALFDKAKQEILSSGKASASFLQRRLRVGYARAARLLDLLEAAGIVSPADGSKAREVYGFTGEIREDADLEDPAVYGDPEKNDHNADTEEVFVDSDKENG